MAYNRGERPDSPMKRRGGRRRKKVCVFCGKENNEIIRFPKVSSSFVLSVLVEVSLSPNLGGVVVPFFNNC